MLKVAVAVWPRDNWWKVDGDAIELKTVRLPLPSARKVIRWKQEAGGREILLDVPEGLHAAGAAGGGIAGPFSPLDKAMAIWERLELAADMLGAGALVLQTKPSFTPTQANRAALRRFFGSVEDYKGKIVWMAGGLWDPHEVADLCEELGMERGVDPLSLEEPEERRWSYGRVQGLGKEKLSGTDLDRLAEWCVWSGSGYCVVDTLEAEKDARMLRARIAQFTE